MDIFLRTCFEASVSGCCACEKILRHSSEEWWALGPNTPEACVFFPRPIPLFPVAVMKLDRVLKRPLQASGWLGEKLHQRRGLICRSHSWLFDSLVWLYRRRHLFNHEFHWTA